MPASTPNLEDDLLGLKGGIEVTGQVYPAGATLPDGYHFEIHRDVIERYNAARAGIVFDEASLLDLYGSTIHSKKVAKNRNEFTKEKRSYEEARDIYNVLARIVATGDLTGSDQLPPQPLKQIAPLTVVNNIVSSWITQLHATNGVEIGNDQKVQLEAIISLALSESKMLDSIETMKEHPDQIDYVKICNVSALDFAIAKSAVGAYITLVKQHGLGPDVSGLAELYRRGLFPLSMLMLNDGVIERMCLLTGREKEELCKAIVDVEETHAMHRAESICTLIDNYEAYTQQLERQRAERIEREERESLAAQSLRTRVVREPKINSHKTGQRTDEMDRIDEAKALIHSSAILVEDAAWFVNTFTTDVLGHEHPLLPDMKGFASVSNIEEPFRADTDSTNIWFVAGVFENFECTLPQRNFPHSHRVSPIQEEMRNVPGVNVRSYVLIARAIDVYTEAVIANSTMRSLLTGDERGPNFAKAVKSLGTIVRDLDALHANSIEALRDPRALRTGVADTHRAWRKLVYNPIMDREPEPGQTVVHLEDVEVRYASMLFHLPTPITKALFANRFVGLEWDLTDLQFGKRLKDLHEHDPFEKSIRIGESMRYTLSTAGIDTVEVPYKFTNTVSNSESYVQYVRPVSERYDRLYEKSETPVTHETPRPHDINNRITLGTLTDR